MDSESSLFISRAVEALHRRPEKAVFYTTGVGAGLQQLLWETPGLSRTLLDAGFPYHPLALEQKLGRQPHKSVSRGTAVQMAGQAYAWALEIAQRSGITDPLIGLGMTGAVATDRERKGADRVIAAVKTADNIYVVEADFEKGAVDRLSAGCYCDLLGLNLLLAASNLEPVIMLETPGTNCKNVAGGRFSLKGGIWTGEFERDSLFMEEGGRVNLEFLDPSRFVLYPGSFNPLHYGHIAVAREVEQMTGKRVVFHITSDHPEKGKIPAADIERRVRQFAGIADVLVTSGDSLYIEKAKRFPGFAFIIGADAVRAMRDPKYYDGPSDLEFMFSDLNRLGTRFYVAGRQVKDEFISAEKSIPHQFKELFIPIPGRWDVQSRDLRPIDG